MTEQFQLKKKSLDGTARPGNCVAFDRASGI